MNGLLGMLLASCMAVSAGISGGFADLKPAADKLTEGCKSAYLMDYDSKKCIYSENETAHMPIASVCKVMTLTLCFDAVADGALSLSDSVTVSRKAAGMGGSQVFLESGATYEAGQLVKSIIVCSANDSCVALAEKLCGSEEEFVSRMNKKAKELGCNDTLFANCTGLPRETQYSCAKDVALMYSGLISHVGYFEYSKIWLEDFIHPGDRKTTMTNTNKLIRRYGYCDGGKTGFTNEAGYCLACTAKKGNMRLISAVLGADSSDNRFDSTVKMFEYGFANYRNRIVLDKDVTLNDEFAVAGGKKGSVAVRPERNSYVFSAVDKSPEISHTVKPFKVKAPVAEGQVVGEIEVYRDGVLADRVNVVAAESVERANFGDYFRLAGENWAL